MPADQLKAKLKEHEDQHERPSQVRMHRAISWLKRAEQEGADFDAQFIFLWISFNAAYAKELGLEHQERGLLAGFFRQLRSVDSDSRLQNLLFDRFTGPIRTLIENRFVFEPFWRALRDHDSSGHWEERFRASKREATTAIVDGHTDSVLGIVFDRLYVLRNQLIHGGATWNSGVNREQVRDGVHLLMAIVPVVIDLMLDHPELDLGNINYPVV